MSGQSRAYGDLQDVELADYHDLNADGGIKSRRINVLADYDVDEANIIGPDDVDRLIEDGDDNIFHREATGYGEKRKLEQFDDLDVLPVDIADPDVRLVNGVGPLAAYIVNEDRPIAALYDVQTGAPFLAHADREQNDRFVPELDGPAEDGYDAQLQVWRQDAGGTVYDKDGEPVADTAVDDRDAPIQGHVAYTNDADVNNTDTAFGLIEYMGGWDRQYRNVGRGPDILLGFPQITVHSDLQDANRLLLDERTVTDDDDMRSIDAAFEDGLREKLGLSDDELAVTTYDATLLKETDDGVEPFMDVQERDLELLQPLDADGAQYAMHDLFHAWGTASMDAAATTMEASADMYAAYVDMWLAPFAPRDDAGHGH